MGEEDVYTQGLVLNRNQLDTDFTLTKPSLVTCQDVVVQDENKNPLKASIFVLDKPTQDSVAYFETDSIIGQYHFKLPAS